MSPDATTNPLWEQARTYLQQSVTGWMDLDGEESLTLPLADEDWLLEVTAEGKLICLAGYDLEDMKSLLSDGTAEDLGSDELAKQAKFYLQQTVSKYRQHLLAQGFTETISMNESFVAAQYERPTDLEDLPQLDQDIATCRSWFSPKR